MTTQQNINDAREVALIDQAAADSCLINRNAFDKYVEQINNNLWNTNVSPMPTAGPFTVSQAALVDVILPADYDYPLVFTYPEIWAKASAKLAELVTECESKTTAAAASKKVLTDLENQYAADIDRANELAAKDPAVIAAKENAAAAAIQRQTELDKKKIDQQNLKVIVGCVAAFFGLIILIAVITRIK